MVYIDSCVRSLRGMTRYLLAWPDNICADLCRDNNIFIICRYYIIINLDGRGRGRSQDWYLLQLHVKECRYDVGFRSSCWFGTDYYVEWYGTARERDVRGLATATWSPALGSSHEQWSKLHEQGAQALLGTTGSTKDCLERDHAISYCWIIA